MTEMTCFIVEMTCFKKKNIHDEKKGLIRFYKFFSQ